MSSSNRDNFEEEFEAIVEQTANQTDMSQGEAAGAVIRELLQSYKQTANVGPTEEFDVSSGLLAAPGPGDGSGEQRANTDSENEDFSERVSAGVL